MCDSKRGMPRKTYLESMLHIDQRRGHVHHGPVPDSNYHRPLEFRTIAEDKGAYMVLP